MEGFSRRRFLQRGTLAVAAAGALATPGLSLLANEGSQDAGDLSPAVGEGAGMAESSGSALGPVVAHIQDATTGEIAIYSGERQVIFRSPEIAARLMHAAR